MTDDANRRTPVSGPGDFVEAVRHVAAAVVSNAVGTLPRLRWAKVTNARPLELKYMDDMSLGSAIPLRPYAPTAGDITLVASFGGYVVALGTSAPAPGGADGGIPVATTMAWAGGPGRPIPSGWLLCDGAAVSRTDYATLFREIGVVYGNGNGSTTFNVPDYRRRVPAGYMFGSADFGVIGQTGGAETHTLSVDQIPAHEHTIYGRVDRYQGSGAIVREPTDSSLATNNTTSSSTGGGEPHNNLPPYITQRFIIKA